MKKILLLGLAVIFLAACEKQKQQYFSESPEIETVKVGIKAYETQDWTTWKANFADTAKIYHNTIKGITPDEDLEDIQEMISNLSSYKFDEKETFIEMVIDKDDETWVNYWSVWKGKLAANNQELTIPVHLTMQFINGKIVKEYGYWDSAPMVMAFQEIASAKMEETTENQ
ncbi:nuclear transport factor 2 family protein [Gaetbulibacter sp. M235]|uniref:nuclear transport factor 2 family protein n=1 Tax=Gaetbulibacter sp. M235 TaxID=3126510 RepID=UPI00374E94FD